MNIAVGHAPRRVLAGLSAAALAVAGLAVAATPADAAETTRFEGDNRYQTAAAIAIEGWGDGEADGAVVASGGLAGDNEFFAINALVSSSLAGDVDGPVLLTNPNDLSAAAQGALEDVLGDDDDGPVYVVGDDVDESVSDELTALGYDVTRIGGADQFETAANVAREVGSDGVAEFNDERTGIVATGNDFADTLAGGPLAYEGHPFFLINNDDDTVPQATEDALTELDIEQVVILGDENAVSEDVEDDIADIVGEDDAVRLGGENRVQTAVEIAQFLIDSFGYDLDEILLASGYENGGVDAIAGGPYGGLTDSPILLVREESLQAANEEFLQNNDAQDATIIGLGDENVIDQIVLAEAEQAAEEGDGEQPTPAPTLTDAPELSAVTIENQGGGFVNLRYTFDEDVTGKTPEAGCFHLYAFDHEAFGADVQNTCDGGHMGDDNTNAASADGDVAFVDSDNPSEVVVNFDVDQDTFAQITLTTVDWDAVQDAAGTENLEGALSIGEGVSFETGQTSAPDLVAVQEFDATANTVEFVFDDEVETVTDDDGTTPDTQSDNFSLIDDDNDVTTSTGAEIQDDPSVVMVTFDDIEDDTEEMTARAAIETGTVTDDDGDDNPQQTVDVSNDGTTDGPDLESVTFDLEDDTATYDFDAPVTVTGDATDFLVYDRSGDEVSSTEADPVARSTEDNSVVEVSFADGVLDSQVGASVNAGAVTGTTGIPTEANEVDEVAVAGQEFAAGTTTGPNLSDARVDFGGDPDPTFGDAADLSVVYVFDEDVTGDPDASRFFIYDEDGTPTRGQAANDADSGADGGDDTLEDNEVRVTFDDPGTADDDENDAVEDAVVATVNDQAVTGEDGTLVNPEGITALQNAGEFSAPE